MIHDVAENLIKIALTDARIPTSAIMPMADGHLNIAVTAEDVWPLARSIALLARDLYEQNFGSDEALEFWQWSEERVSPTQRPYGEKVVLRWDNARLETGV